MNKYIKTNKGYYYEISKNSKKRISEKEYYKNNNKILHGGTIVGNFIKRLMTNINNKESSREFKNIYQLNNPNDEKIPFERFDEYDLHFLSSICYLKYGPDIVNPFDYYIVRNNKKMKKTINFSSILYNQKNKNSYPGQKRLQFFKEEIYEGTPNDIITEYNNFVRTGSSEIFFKSNIVNIAKLIECYDRGCYDDFFKKIVTKNRIIINEKDFEQIANIFIFQKTFLIQCLINAYITCSYIDICELYKRYLLCYKNTYGKYLKHASAVTINYELSTKINRMTISDVTDIFYDKIIKEIENSLKNNFFIYLSCIHVSEYKQTNLYLTRFIDSYIGNLDVHGFINNIFDIIIHDFEFHGNLERVIKIEDRLLDINRIFIKGLYNFAIKLYNIEVYKYGMFIIQNIQNEILKGEIIILNETFFDYLVHDIRSHTYYFKYSEIKDKNIELFTKFIEFVNSISSKRNKNYNIKIKNYNSSQHIFQIIIY